MKKLPFLIGTAALLSFFFFSKMPVSNAQTATPQLLITWKALGSYIPPSYTGKALPTIGSRISAALQAFGVNGPVDLSSQTIYWYLNDDLIGGGPGVDQITFPPLGEPPDTLTLRAEIPSYPGGFLSHEVEVPLVNPQVVILSPFANGRTSENPVFLSALTYFFTVSDPFALSYVWQVNGESGSGSENPEVLKINFPANTPSGTNFDISVLVRNRADSTVAEAETSLQYVKTL